jgi:creatinine amidohydrolase
MSVHELAHLSWESVRELDREQTIAILPVGAIEAHGPHLPLETDVIIAAAMARAGAARLSSRGHAAVVLPPIVYTTARFAAAFPGTLSISSETVTALIVDIATGLTQQQFRLLVLANAHLDPAHLASLDDVVKRARAQRLLPIVFPNIAKNPWASRLGDEFKSGACHAGRFESSIVMAEQPLRVHDPVRRSLPSNPISLSQAIREGKSSFTEAGGPRAYFGAPADATRDEGNQLIAVLGEIVKEAVGAELER